MKKIIVVLSLCLVGVASAHGAESPTETLQKGLFEEEANHNLEAAIKAYQAVVQQTDEQRKLAATAIFRLGECYRKLGKTNEATGQYERIIRQYAEQTTLVDLSRQTLAGLGVSASKARGTALPSQSAFDEAVEVERIKALIKDSPDLINSSEPGNYTLLQEAASAGRLAVAQFLLSNKADVNGRGKRVDVTPLQLAVERGHKSMVELLLKNGADVNAVGGSDGLRGTPLHAAAANGYRSVAEVLIANKADLEARNREGSTPLHSAVRARQSAAAELLLGQGADVNAKDVNLRTPLHFAVEQNDRAMFDLLLSHKAAVNAQNDQGTTPLMLAIETKNLKLAESLLENGADVNLGNRSGLSPLRAALSARTDGFPGFGSPFGSPNSSAGSPAMLQLLLAHKPNLEERNSDQLTPLQAAVLNDSEMAKLLMDAGANVNGTFQRRSPPLMVSLPGNQPVDLRDLTPLMVSTIHKQADLVDALLAHGAEINAQSNQDGKTALHFAVWENSLPIVQSLLAHHANTEIRDNSGYTPLLLAPAEPLQIAEALLKGGANADATLLDGNTRLHWAVSNRQKSLVELLVAFKANVNAVNKQGDSPLTEPNPSQSAVLDEIKSFLIEHGADPNLRRRSLITATRRERDFNVSLFFKGTNTCNDYSLFELLAALYGGVASAGSAFPDFAHVRILRLGDKPGSEQSMSINLEKLLGSGDCTQDIWLEWGDIVEIPEQDHALSESWPGLSQDAQDLLQKCLKREVEFVVKGERTRKALSPSLKSTSVRPGLIGVPYVPPAPVVFGSPSFGGRGATVTPAEFDSWRFIMPFRLKDVLYQAHVVRVSSDLTHVKVKRKDPKTGQSKELGFNLSEGAPYDPRTDLWLRDGDVIEVPEK